MSRKTDYLVQIAKRVRISSKQGKIKGFNGADYDFVSSLLNSYQNNGSLTDNQAQKLQEVLSQYRTQVNKIGGNFRKINRMKFKVGKDVSIWFDTEGEDVWMCIKSPYDKNFVANIKSIPKNMRKWDNESKIWKVKVTTDKKYVGKAIKYVERNYDEDIDVNIPDVKFGCVSFKDNEFYFDVEKNNKFSNRIRENIYTSRYDGNRWIVRPRKISEVEEIIGLIEDFDIDVGKDVLTELMSIKDRIKKEKERKKEIYELSKQKSLESEYLVDLPSDDLELYPFQKYGVKMLDLRKKGFICDDLGAGKTIEVLAHLYNHQEIRPTIIIMPSSVKINWKREIVKWTEANEEDIYILSGQNGYIVQGKKFYLVNYAILHHRLEDLKELDYEGLVIDESHFIKNKKSKRTQASLELAKKVENTYLLTGTPMPNRPVELWPQLQALQPDEPDFQSFWGDNGYEGFAKKYCGAHKRRMGNREWWDVEGATNLDELYNKLRRSIMIRRKKMDVLDELPEKRRFEVPIELENRDEYNQALNNFSEWMEEHSDSDSWQKNELLVKIQKLQQLSWKGKYENMVEWIDEVVEQSDKLVVFAHHTDLQDKLYERYKDKGVHIGSGMSSEERQDVIDRFTNDEDTKVCIASIKAGGVGINLQIAHRAVFTQILWSPSDHSQAEGRVHRAKGSEDVDQVDIYYLMAENTVEESMFKVMNEKQKIIDEAIDGITEEKEKGILMDVLEDMDVD